MVLYSGRNAVVHACKTFPIQYGARDKSLSGVVGRPTTGESLRVQLASQA